MTGKEIFVDDQPGRIVAVGLSKNFGTVRAVDNLSFTVEPGSVTGFLGPNGAGKTTTLRMLLGLVTPNAGIATIGGHRYAEVPYPLHTVGAVLEASSFHPGRTALNHLRVYAAASKIPDRRAEEVLAQVGLTDAAGRKTRGFSLGMKQRLGLAFALLGNPRVLILDEPANGLDPEGILWLRGFLRAMAAAGRTVLVSSHLLAEVQQIADRVIILSRGRLVREGSLAELTAGVGETVVVRSPQADLLAGALAGAPVATPARAAGGTAGGATGGALAGMATGTAGETLGGTAGGSPAEVTRSGPDELQIKGLPAAAVGHAAFTAGVELHELRTERADLEQLFFSLTQAEFSAAVPGGAYPQQLPAGTPAPSQPQRATGIPGGDRQVAGTAPPGSAPSGSAPPGSAPPASSPSGQPSHGGAG